MQHRLVLACALSVGAAAAALSSPAAADDEGRELWLNPTISRSLDEATRVELETSQRLRREADGREDTYYVRLWLNRDLAAGLTASGGIERRANEPGADETRLLQQLSAEQGIWRARARLEQRFVDDQRMGVRVTTRAGVAAPIGGDESPWTLIADAEVFFTLRAASADGEEGLTGLRTRLGASYAVSERLSLTLAYLRQEAFSDDGPDVVGHAPLIGVELSL